MAPVTTQAIANELAAASALDRRTPARRSAPVRPVPAATDDEILGLTASPAAADAEQANPGLDSASEDVPDLPAGLSETANTRDPSDAMIPEPIRAALDANPDLRRAWDDAVAYREAFATPEAARAATAQIADLDRLDALFYSRRPEDHAELARAVAALDAEAFASLAQAMQGLVGAQQIVNGNTPQIDRRHAAPRAAENSSTAENPPQAAQPSTPSVAKLSNENRRQDAGATPTQAQTDFLHSTNAAAVQSVLDAIETQVERLLPEDISKSARNRVVGEIYRELDTTLCSNRQLAQQMREAFRGGGLDAEHQRAVVTLITGRARQALPGVAKRVLNEWTSTVVAAHNDRRARQQAAERRVDIGGSGGAGGDGPRSMTPREVDYRRMSDADILNL
jgi:hypothetical protein